eukprot:GHVU01060999.1.p1 GENE.GHVU01060999.1~~GHVU01060999.1.p1  ORF type:complete len:260 (+),score=17.23 GHVU01060999.1:785-1564(+)
MIDCCKSSMLCDAASVVRVLAFISVPGLTPSHLIPSIPAWLPGCRHSCSPAASGCPWSIDISVLLLQQETVRGARIGALRVTTEILSRDGPMGLWRGVLVSSIRVVPGAGLYFFSASILADSYGWLERRRVLRTKPSSGLDDSSPAPSRAANTPPLWYTAFVGAAARSFAGFVVSPATVVKTRMESAQYGSQVGPRGLVVHCRELMHTEGFRGFYKGLLPTLARDVPYSGLSFALYTRFRDTAAATVGSPRVPPPLARG